MSYALERGAVHRFIKAHSFFGLNPFGLDGGGATLVAGGGYLTLTPGVARRASTGSPGANLVRYYGLVHIVLITDAGSSAAARAKADEIIAAFTGVKIDETGALADGTGATILDFEPAGQIPYIAESRAETPFHRVLVNAPFVRTERK